MDVKFALDLVRLYVHSKTDINALRPRKAHPIRSSIRLTENCNAGCITCNFWQRRWEDKVSKKRWVEVIGQLRSVGVRRLRFTGGEPLLRKDFLEILAEIEHLGFDKVTLASNGLLVGKFASEINDSCLTDLGISIDGLRETNDYIRGIDGYFELSTSNLRKISGKRVTIMTTLASVNVEDLEGLIEMCEGNGWKWDFNLLDDSLYFLQNCDVGSLWPTREQTERIFEVIERHRHLSALSRINNIQLRYAKKYYLREVSREPMCFLGYTDIDLDSSGNVYSGCYPVPPVGNILDRDIPDILNSPEYAQRLRAMVERNCPGCVCGYELNIGIEALPRYALERVFNGRFK